MPDLTTCCTNAVNSHSGTPAQIQALIAQCVATNGLGFADASGNSVTSCVNGTQSSASGGTGGSSPLPPAWQVNICNAGCYTQYASDFVFDNANATTNLANCLAKCAVGNNPSSNLPAGSGTGTAGGGSSGGGTGAIETGCTGCAYNNLPACFQCAASTATKGLKSIGINIVIGLVLLFGVYLLFSDEINGSVKRVGKAVVAA